MSKTALITGGTGGIGQEAVRTFAKNGYNVAFTYHKNEAAANKLCDEIKGSLAVRCNVAVGAEVDTAVESVLSRFGKIDVLINNAAIAEQVLFTDITEERWDTMININLKSCFLTCKAVLPQMISRKDGIIINVASMWGEVGASCEVHYSAAKSGVIGLTKALAKEVGPSGIRVNAVSPGIIDTPMPSHLSKADIDVIKEEIPLGTVGSPADVAELMLFLSGGGGRYITGQVISPNGGMVI